MKAWTGMIGSLLLLSGVAARGGEVDSTQAGRMRVYVDPETGEITEPPAPPVEPQAAEPPAFLQGQAAGDDLVEQVNPAGGYSIDLQRRFGGLMRAAAAAPPNAAVVECEAGDEKVAD